MNHDNNVSACLEDLAIADLLIASVAVIFVMDKGLHAELFGRAVLSLLESSTIISMFILAARHAHDANLIVLGGAILMGIIWIPYGWAADDPVGLQHAIGRGLLSYVAFVYVPSPYKATGISCVVLLAYLYSLLRMKRPPKDVTGR